MTYAERVHIALTVAGVLLLIWWAFKPRAVTYRQRKGDRRE